MDQRSEMSGGRVSPNVSIVSRNRRPNCPCDCKFAAIGTVPHVVLLLSTVIMFWTTPGNIVAQSKPNTKWEEVRRVAKQDWTVEYSYRTGHDEVGHTYHRLSVNHDGQVKKEITSGVRKGTVSQRPRLPAEQRQRVLDRTIQQLEEYKLEFEADEGKLVPVDVRLRAGRCAVTIALTEKQDELGSGMELIFEEDSPAPGQKTIRNKASTSGVENDNHPQPKRADDRTMPGCRLFDSPPEKWDVVVLLFEASGHGWRLAMKHDGTGKVSEYDDSKPVRIWEHLLMWEKADATSILTAAAKDVSQFSFKESRSSEKQDGLSISLFLKAKERRIQFDESGVQADRLDATVVSNILKAFRERVPEDILNRIPALKLTK